MEAIESDHDHGKDHEIGHDSSDDSSPIEEDDHKKLSSQSQNNEDAENENVEFHHDEGQINLGISVSAEKRKERNKILARKSRLKMKIELENLKEQLGILMKENESLKEQMNSIVTTPVNVVELVKNDIQLPDNIMQLVKQLMMKTEKSVMTPKKIKRSSFCIANAISVDIPIVYASPGFLKLTGYDIAEVLGRNCRFLQGPKTDLGEVAKMKQAITEGRDITVVLLNYRKDGKIFLNQVQLAHLKDQSGKTFLIVGIQTKVKIPTKEESSNTMNGSNHTSRTNSPLSHNQSKKKGQVLHYPDMQYYRPTYGYAGAMSSTASMSSHSHGSRSNGGNSTGPRDFIPANYLNSPLIPTNPFVPETTAYYPFTSQLSAVSPPFIAAPLNRSIPTTSSHPFPPPSSSSSIASPSYPPSSIVTAMKAINSLPQYPPSSSSPAALSIAPPSYYPVPPQSIRSNPVLPRQPTRDPIGLDYPPLPSAVYYDFHLPLAQPNLTATIQSANQTLSQSIASMLSSTSSTSSYAAVEDIISRRLLAAPKPVMGTNPNNSPPPDTSKGCFE